MLPCVSTIAARVSLRSLQNHVHLVEFVFCIHSSGKDVALRATHVLICQPGHITSYCNLMFFSAFFIYCVVVVSQPTAPMCRLGWSMYVCTSIVACYSKSIRPRVRITIFSRSHQAVLLILHLYSFSTRHQLCAHHTLPCIESQHLPLQTLHWICERGGF